MKCTRMPRHVLAASPEESESQSAPLDSPLANESEIDRALFGAGGEEE